MAEPNNNQMAFWEAMKEKYERRNESLRQQEICLRKRLEQLAQIMEQQKAGDDCDCVPEKLEKPSLVQCLVEKGKNLILGSCKCGDPKIGEDLLCACHIQDPKAPLNVDPNLCPLQEPSPPEGCSNPSCDFYDPTLGHLAENPSTFSLKTTDIYYMDKLADLVKAEKNMQEKIEDLEKREHSYLTAIHDLQEAMKKQPKVDPMNKEFKKLTEGLEEENRKLRNELEDLRLELKHCFERVEGPLRRSLEDQRDKCSKLENDLKDLHARTKMKEDSYLKEINEVKAKLCQACCTMVDLNNVNSKLKNDLGSLQNKCANLEDELLKQQLKEAENILKFKNALSKRTPKNKIQAKGDESEQDLSHIAKKLGDTLKEVCPCVSDVPSGLAETAENIRQLTEFVVEKGAQQRKKRKGKIPQIDTRSCSCGSDIKAPETPTKSQETCICSNSSLRIKPRIGKNDFDNENENEIEAGSSSATLVSVPTMNIRAIKQTPKQKSAPPVKKTASKGCTCCPAKNDCDHPPPNTSKESIETICCCSDVDNKRTGPSEEVIAVKNLGTLSMPPGEQPFAAKTIAPLKAEPPKAKDHQMNKSKRDKLAVDTTCDVLDTPPKDIHVVTTIAKTGSLEITTEGPPGVIETKVNYLPDGKIEIVTKLIDRHNMDDFLDGTLLHAPEGPPDCDESHTCQGQCDDKATSAEGGCPEVDCNQSKTCEGLCDREAEAPKDEAGTDQNNLTDDPQMNSSQNSDNVQPYGQIVVNNNFILISEENNPFKTREWKNVKFLDDPKEETWFQDLFLMSRPKGKRQEKVVVHSDITSEQETFRLSSRQSLTDVEKYTKEDSFIKSSNSFVCPDVLDTISEGDEEQTDSSRIDEELTDTSRADGNGVVAEKEEVKESTTDDLSGKGELIDLTVYGDEKDEIAAQEVGCLNIKPSELETIDILKTEENSSALPIAEVEKLNPSPTNTQQPCVLPTQEPTNEDQSPEMNITEESIKSTRSSTIVEDVAGARSECQITESFYKLSRNFNVVNGRITLKQSKSMYERRGSKCEYLRICKSATLSLGSLKIDVERLKLSSKDPKVGDFGGLGKDEIGRVLAEDVLVPLDDVKEEPTVEKDEKVISDVLTEGCKLFESYLPEQTYQCYVCSCSNQNNKDNQQKKPPQNNRNNQGLEERIDRLLEIDPLAASHGCQCGVDRPQTRNDDECKCSKKMQDLAQDRDPSRQRCKCGAQTVRLNLPKSEAPKQQGDNLQHGENCTCVDCICNPCNFKKDATMCDCKKCECEKCCGKDNRLTSLIAFELTKPQEITVMNVSLPCDCGGKCPCSPCMDESKKPPSRIPQPQAKTQQQGKGQETSCKRCAGRVPGAQNEESRKADIAVGSSRTKTGPPESVLPDTWKNVVGCACDPPPDDRKAVCDCKTCECKPCGYPEKARKPCDCKPPKKEPKSYGPSGKCDCKTCQCEFCGDVTIGDTKRDEMSGDSSTIYPFSAINCDCKLCECLFCSDPKTRKQPDPTPPGRAEAVEQHIVPQKAHQQNICGCRPKCLCDHCPVYEEKVGDATGPNCDCAKCECDPCYDPKSLAVTNLKDFLKEMKIKSAEKITLPGNTAHCDCAECKCEYCVGKLKENPFDEKSGGDNLNKPVSDAPKADDDNLCPCMKSKIEINEPMEECNDCDICPPKKDANAKPIEKIEEKHDEKHEEKHEENTPRYIPCNCPTPCSCSPCPDPYLTRKNKPQMMGDADRAKEEIKNVLNKIGCTCDEVEDDLKPLVKQASNFETTISRMKMKLNNLQQKCKDKDQIIDAMTNELRMRSQSWVFADLLHDLAHPKDRFTPDYTRTYVCDFLPKPKHAIGSKLQPKRSSLCRFDNRLEPILELDRYLPGTKDDFCPKNLDVSAMEIIDIRRVTIDSILIKWRGPSNLNGVTGYQVFVNDELKYRVLSPNRTNAVIDSLDLSTSLEIMLFAMTCCGRCEPPALATYKI